MTRADGFTRLELLLVVLLVAVIAGIAVPNYLEVVRSTRAMQAVADLYAVRAAAYLCYGDTAKWPPEAPTGVVPPELSRRIPGNVQFTGEHYRLDWENWSDEHGEAAGPSRQILVGVSVVSADPKLLTDVEQLLSRSTFAQRETGRITLRIAGPNGF